MLTLALVGLTNVMGSASVQKACCITKLLLQHLAVKVSIEFRNREMYESNLSFSKMIGKQTINLLLTLLLCLQKCRPIVLVLLTFEVWEKANAGCWNYGFA